MSSVIRKVREYLVLSRYILDVWLTRTAWAEVLLVSLSLLLLALPLLVGLLVLQQLRG